MPYLYAHAIHALLAHKKYCGERLPPLRELLHERTLTCDPLPRLYLWGAQGPDVWFYHGLLHPVHSLRKVGNLLHARNVEATLSHMAEAAAGDRLRLTYFAGFLTHYALDKTAHPYVHSFCGSHAWHTRFEADCDAALLALLGTDCGETPPALTMPPLTAKEQSAFCAMQGAAAKGSGVTGCEKPLRLLARKIPAVLRMQRDKKGRKLRFLQGVERLFFGQKPVVSRFVFPLAVEKDVLNLRREPWPVPWSGEERTEDFLCLMDAASNLAAEYLRALSGWVQGRSTREAFLALLGADSFDNGLPWRDSFVEEPYAKAIYTKK